MLLRRIVAKANISFNGFTAIRQCSKDTKNVQKKDDINRNIIVEKYGGITTLNIDRAESRNSLDLATITELVMEIDEFEKDDKAIVLVLNGEGGSFCSGFDMDEIETKGYTTLTDAASRLCRRPLCYKPTIAAVSGFAVAEGFELALACDLRVIEDNAVMGFLGRRFGVPQSLLGSTRLTSLIGLSQTLAMSMTGRLITGEEAHKKGLAAKLTSTGTSLGEAIKLAKSLVKFPQSALIMDKLAAVSSQLNPNGDEMMRDEAILQSLFGNALADIKIGVSKFQQGIGKHGKFYNLKEVPLKDWELESSDEEIIVKTKDVKKDK